MMDRDQKLAKLNKQSEDRDQAKQDQLQEVADSLENAVNDLKHTFGLGVDINGLADLIEQISELKGFKDSVDELKSAISELPETVKVDDIDGIVDAIREIELKSPDVILPKTKDIDVIGLVASIINAINALGARIEANKPAPQGQKPLDYVPYRRVIKVGNAFQFDDTETPVAQGGGSGGGTPTVNGYVPVVNPDGSTIGGQSDGLTDAELRASPIDVQGTFYSTTAQYAVIADNKTTGGVIYIGYADAGTATSAASWRIKKVDISNYPVITWADGDTNFNNVFDNRVSLTYS
jgi:hypothetical protein